MSAALWQLAGAILGLGVVVFLATLCGKRSAQLGALKTEIKKEQEEQNRVQKIINRVDSMDERDVRNRLHGIANKK